MLVFPPVFEWDDGKMPDSFKPRCHMFYGARTFDFEDGVPKFEGMKERSDTLPECEGDSDWEEEDQEQQKTDDQKASKPLSANGRKKHSREADDASNGTAANANSIAANVKRLHTNNQAGD